MASRVLKICHNKVGVIRVADKGVHIFGVISACMEEVELREAERFHPFGTFQVKRTEILSC